MSYEPQKITKEHVLKAVEKIKIEKPKLRPPTRYYVIIDGEAYPPKEIMRYAHREMNGELLKERFLGGEPGVNKFFTKLGYEIRPKADFSHQKTYTNNMQKIDLIVKLYSESVEVEFKNSGNILFNIGCHINFNRIPNYLNARKKLIGIINGEAPNENTRILLLQFFQKPKTPNDSDNEYDKLLDLYKVKPVKSGNISVINAPIARAFLNQFKPLNNIPSTQKDKGAWDEFLKDKTKVDRNIDRFILELRKKIEYKNKVFSIKIDSQSMIYKSEDGSVINEIIWAANLFEEPYTLNKNDCFKDVTKWVNSPQLGNDYITRKLKESYNEELLSKSIPFSFYLDQLLNLIHKVDDADIKNTVNKKFEKLYKTALEIKELGNGKNKVDNNFENTNSMKETSKEEEKRPSLNTILYGPPGTGKTYNTINKAVEIIKAEVKKKDTNIQDEERKNILDLYRAYAGINDKKESLFNKELSNTKINQVEFVTFHQNYTYEDFVVGLKPNTENDDKLTFKENYGIFYRICKEAYHNPNKNYVLIIDEINRANISRVFGELITLLEDDKRIGKENELIVTLPNGEAFGVPPNLYIIGTMNTADKSIALIDIALRRRFEFEPKFPEPDKLKKEDADLLKIINKNIINQGKSADFTIGHAFFMKGMDTEDVIKQKIIPLLMEYFNNNTSTVEKVLVGTGYEFKYSSNTYLWSAKSEESINVENPDSDTK